MSEAAMLDDLLTRLCPMHLILDAEGTIRHAGPTLQKLRPGAQLAGQRFLELFRLTRPRAVTGFADLMADADGKLSVGFRDAPHTTLKGQIVAVPGGAVVALSFGISLLDAVRDYDLTSADFAPTDLAIELLYLVEAKSAAMEASRQLNQRLQAARIAAEEQAFTDTLTGLKNRRAMDHVLARKSGGGMPYSLMHIDLDFFKQVNDTLGHAAGDHVLQQVAQVLVEETRREDTVARVGGDEFVIVFDNLTDRPRLQRIARRLIERLEHPMRFQGRTCAISASIGLALSVEEPGCAPEDLLHHADLALYAAKRAGRATMRFYATPAPGDAARCAPGWAEPGRDEVGPEPGLNRA
ncbi:diguanylate cyclase domain-containing protein [Antarcticimicrobium luteum]|uniref:guanylate cyclase n=1 Tax=Antarcticimicrobium luteum TaxID=2547397 RepID=A0A4R5VGF5_9RHOB|nr:diguanylate cyclase [Antarcticimicrobium luteum]TDK52359.1 diguanylate cyclase [Antarcticimicrobium luteum]